MKFVERAELLNTREEVLSYFYPAGNIHLFGVRESEHRNAMRVLRLAYAIREHGEVPAATMQAMQPPPEGGEIEQARAWLAEA